MQQPHTYDYVHEELNHSLRNGVFSLEEYKKLFLSTYARTFEIPPATTRQDNTNLDRIIEKSWNLSRKSRDTTVRGREITVLFGLVMGTITGITAYNMTIQTPGTESTDAYILSVGTATIVTMITMGISAYQQIKMTRPLIEQLEQEYRETRREVFGNN